jgi:hypothetical protein
VASPYLSVQPVGSHVFTCAITNANYTPTTLSNTLTVSDMGTGCTNISTFAYTTTVVPTDENVTWLDFTAERTASIIRADMQDINSTDANLTVLYNSTGAYLIARNLTPASFTVHFGNFYATLGLLNASTVNGTQAAYAKSQLSPYVYTFSEYDEMANIPGRPPAATNVYYSLFCPGGTNFVTLNGTTSTTQTIAAYSQLSRAELDVRYTATSYYYRDLLFTTPVASRIFYWADATTTGLVKTSFTLHDNSGLFANASLYVQKQIADGLPSITEGQFDSENKMVAYLIEGQEYQLTVTSGPNSRLIGLLYSDSANPEKSIIIGSTGQPSSQNYTYSVTQDNVTGTVRFLWIDPGSHTVNTTFAVYNATNQSQLLYYASSAAQNVEFTYTPTVANATLKVVTHVSNSVLGMNSPGGTYWFGVIAAIILMPITSLISLVGAAEAKNIMTFCSGVFLLILAMSFGSAYSKMGAIVVALIGTFFAYMGWWPVSGGLMVIILLLAVLNRMSDKRSELT